MMYRRPLIPAQQERKVYNWMNDVVIPFAQATIAAWAITFVIGMGTYLVVRAGPEPMRILTGWAILSITVYLVAFRPISRDAKVTGFLLGSICFLGSQWGFVNLTPIWPHTWAIGEVWRNWFHTWYIGPMVGCVALARRMLREVDDPMKTGAPIYVGPEQNEGRRKRPLERVTWVHSVKNDDGETVREQPVEVEEVWEEEKPGPTLREHLLSFIVTASRVGLSKNAWLKPHTDRRRLSTKLKVSKGEYDKLIGVLRRMGILNKPGPGEATEWLIEPRKAYLLVGEGVGGGENFEASGQMEREG